MKPLVEKKAELMIEHMYALVLFQTGSRTSGGGCMELTLATTDINKKHFDAKKVFGSAGVRKIPRTPETQKEARSM